MGNRDTVNQNFALYQPKDSDKFYFLPWDYDGALGFEGQPDIKKENTYTVNGNYQRVIGGVYRYINAFYKTLNILLS